MTLLIKGIDRLSQLLIDADKDWNTKGITNIKQAAALMAKGDILARNDTILVRIGAGGDGYVLTATGVGKMPVWAPAGGALKYYFPLFIDLTDAEAIVVPHPTYDKDIPITSPHVENYLDDVAHNLTRLDRAVTLVDAEAIVVADIDYPAGTPNITAAVYSWKKVVDGAAKEDFGAAPVDDTLNAQSDAPNDMVLLPALPVANDAYYFGFVTPFDIVWLNIGTAGVGNWAFAEEYWDGVLGAWTALAGVVDGTGEFTIAGLHSITFTRPADWALTNIAGKNLYWMRCRVSAFVSINIQPLGTQAWCEVILP